MENQTVARSDSLSGSVGETNFSQGRSLALRAPGAFLIDISPVMFQLHWLPVKYRIVFNIIIITFKTLQSNGPFYSSQLFHLRRRRPSYLLAPPLEITRKTTGVRYFASTAPTLWNALPANLRIEKNFYNFKEALKTHLLKI